MLPRLPRLALALALGGSLGLGCGGGEGPTGPSTTAPSVSGLAESWMALVVKDPKVLAPFELPATGDAWLSLFHNDLTAASRAFGTACTNPGQAWEAERASGYPCVGLARIHIELAQMYAVAFEVDRVALRQFYRHRRAHEADVLASKHQDYFEGIVLLHSGETARGTALLTQYAGSADGDPMLAALATRIAAGLDGSDPLVVALWGAGASAPADASFDALPPSEATANLRARLTLGAAISRGDVAGAAALVRPILADQPDLREELPARPGDHSAVAPAIEHHDPVILRTYSRLHASWALQALGQTPESAILRAQAESLLGKISEPPVGPSLADGLALVLFSTSPTPEDLRQTILGPTGSPTRARFAPEFPQLALEATVTLSDLDEFVAGSNAAKAKLEELLRATPEGAAMDNDMGLSERLRSQLLQERAKEFQTRFKVHMEEDLGQDAASAGVAAKTLLEFALDKNPSPPNARLKLARISFRNDPPSLVELARANLDTRHPYDANEYIRPLTEIYPDLVPVRDALAALDSAWNPAQKGSVR